jgi:glycosyltransferase involved in cell wall biosynthesis
MNEEQKISVVINTYNACQHLAKVLDAVRDFDEVVVCDMESTDNTVDIARQYGCKVVTFPKADHKSAEPARTFAIQSASNKWVLVVDADEIVTPELRDALYRKIQEPGCPEGFYIPRQNMFMGMFVRDFHYDYQLRFFIREGTEWPPYVHTFPKVQGRVVKLKAAKEARMLHLMDETMHEYMAKLNEYTDNEVEKKRQKGYGLWALLWRPLWRFSQCYFLEGAFKMGTRGVIRAGLAAVYQFSLVSKIIEERSRGKKEEGRGKK